MDIWWEDPGKRLSSWIFGPRMNGWSWEAVVMMGICSWEEVVIMYI